MPKKGHRSTQGIGDIYEEPKQNTTLVLTETARQCLDERAKELEISRSELVERFARGLVGLPGDLTREDKEEASKSFRAVVTNKEKRSRTRIKAAEGKASPNPDRRLAGRDYKTRKIN